MGVVLSGEIWIPVLYKLKVVSIYEYFEGRYQSKFPRLLMTIIFMFKVSWKFQMNTILERNLILFYVVL